MNELVPLFFDGSWLDDIREFLDSILTFQIQTNEDVIRKGAQLLIDCNQYFHLSNGCYSKERDDAMVENGCMEFYYQSFFIITEQIFTLFKAGLNVAVCSLHVTVLYSIE